MPDAPPKPVDSPAIPEVWSVPLGMFETNCYVVSVPGSNECWIVDAGDEPSPLIERVQRLGLRPLAVLLTHAHCDHIAGLHEVCRSFPGIPVLLHEIEHGWLADPMKNLSAAIGQGVVAPPATGTLTDGMALQLGGTTWRMLHTPGHSPGSVSLIHEPSSQALVGDTLFHGSIGRTDFPGSSPETLEHSIRTGLYALSDQTRVYPGHGPSTTIGRERASNPYVRDR